MQNVEELGRFHISKFSIWMGQDSEQFITSLGSKVNKSVLYVNLCKPFVVHYKCCCAVDNKCQ